MDMKNRPIKPSEHLADFLYEQGETPEDERELARVLTVLDEWQAPIPTSAENERLLKQLMSFVPAHSSVRNALNALHERRQGILGELSLLLKLVRIQVSLFSMAFWLTSAIIVLSGCLLVLSETNLSRAVTFQIIGPLLCYLGAASVFRGIGLNILELELVCPPSPRQLTIARIVVVLGYDIGLCTIASLILSPRSGEEFLALILHWLAPLLLIFGLTLLFSLRMPVYHAAVVTYTGWLAFLLFSLSSMGTLRAMAGAFSTTTEGIFGLIGLVLLIMVVVFAPVASSRLIPRR